MLLLAHFKLSRIKVVTRSKRSLGNKGHNRRSNWLLYLLFCLLLLHCHHPLLLSEVLPVGLVRLLKLKTLCCKNLIFLYLLLVYLLRNHLRLKFFRWTFQQSKLWWIFNPCAIVSARSHVVRQGSSSSSTSSLNNNWLLFYFIYLFCFCRLSKLASSKIFLVHVVTWLCLPWFLVILRAWWVFIVWFIFLLRYSATSTNCTTSMCKSSNTSATLVLSASSAILTDDFWFGV